MREDGLRRAKTAALLLLPVLVMGFASGAAAFAAQAVNNQKTADDVARVQANLDCCCKELRDKICDERNARKCADNTIVTYANSTFYAKLVAGITPTTTTTPQQVYNPLPQSNDCCCDCN